MTATIYAPHISLPVGTVENLDQSQNALPRFREAPPVIQGEYKKICRVSENLRVLDDSADANSCRTIAVDSQAQEYQIGCRDSENTGTIIVTAPFHITDKAARVTSSKLAAHAQNTATPEQFAQCAKVWGSR
jgi:hypothetical protein